jgi:hypothetical protein
VTKLSSVALVFLGCVAVSPAAHVYAGDNYTTHHADGTPIAVLNRVEGPGSFGPAWMDPSGAIWSRYIGDYSNDAIKSDQNGIVVDSLATEACAKIGGVLPTASDYQRLASSFELDNRQLLTDQGKKDWVAVFPDMQGHWFWSSTVDPDAGYSTFDADTFNGDDFNFDYDLRSTPFAVRCVLITL